MYSISISISNQKVRLNIQVEHRNVIDQWSQASATTVLALIYWSPCHLPPATSHHPLPSLGSPNCELSFAWIILQLYRAAVIAPAAELAHVVYEYEYECECEYE